ERGAHRLDGPPVGAYRHLEIGEVVDEREVDDPVAAGGAGAQGVQVVQVAAEHPGARGRYGGGRGIRPGEPEDMVTRAGELGDDGRADPAGRAGDEYPHANLLMSVTVVSLAQSMSVAVIAYHRAMGRWEPDARGRLAKSAMELYGEQGFDQTTVAQIAARAGLTERTFFRHFADKREVLFY